MNNIRINIFLFFILLNGFLTAADINIIKNDSVPAGVEINNPEENSEKYPDHDHLVIYEHESIDVDYVRGIGLETYIESTSVKKYFKNSSKYKDLALFIGKEDEIVSLSVTTVKPDGSRVYLQKDQVYNIKTIKTGKGHKSEFSRITYPVPSLQNGDTVIVKYTIIRKSVRLDHDWYVQSSVPVKKTSKEISVPSWMIEKEHLGWEWIDKPFNFGKKIQPEIKKGFSDYVYYWEFENVEPFEPEQFSEGGWLDSKFIKISISGWSSWKKFSEWYFNEKIKPLFGLNVPESIKNKAEELVKNAKTVDEKIFNIVRYVQQLPYDSLHVGFGYGIQPNKPVDILRRGRGDCKDKSILIKALLGAVGIESDPAVLLTRGEKGRVVYEDIPDDYFNHMIIRIHYPGIKNGFVWADGTTDAYPVGNLPFDDADRFALVMKKGGSSKLIKTPSFEFSSKKLNESRKIDVKMESFEKAAVTFSITGFNENSVHLEKKVKDRSIKEQTESFRFYLGHYFPFNEIKDIRTEKDYKNSSFKISFNSDVMPKLIASSEYRLFRPFDIFFPHMPDLKISSIENRKTDIYLGNPENNEAEINITIPDGYFFHEHPESFEIKLHNLLTFKSEVTVKDQNLNIKIRTEKMNAVIPAEFADELYEALVKINTYSKELVYLKKKE
jgi:hypothetical protein